jgi:2-polyprenyl-6-hydroxyphenyl methylase/3-demethylubiquinone-9 3-methyltransferase
MNRPDDSNDGCSDRKDGLTTADPFVEYYAHQSLSAETAQRFRSVMALVHRMQDKAGLSVERLAVGDIGCNTGTQSIIWAEAGHTVRGLDINQGLLAIARQRSREKNFDIEFTQGSATKLPWATDSLDVCLLPELLEHIADWEPCLDEACRVLRHGGVLYVSTTNRLCPLQMEFELPLYSWYPAPIKRYCEKLSVTTRPEWVNHAKYPAVNWFTPYQLRRYLENRGFSVFDRFDVMDLSNKGDFSRGLVGAVRKIPLLRFLGHVATTYTMVIGIRN